MSGGTGTATSGSTLGTVQSTPLGLGLRRLGADTMATFNFRSRDPRGFALAERSRQRPLPARGEQAAPLSVPPCFADADEQDQGWLTSSYELRRGLLVTEEALDTLPAELQDAFTRRRR